MALLSFRSLRSLKNLRSPSRLDEHSPAESLWFKRWVKKIKNLQTNDFTEHSKPSWLSQQRDWFLHLTLKVDSETRRQSIRDERILSFKYKHQIWVKKSEGRRQPCHHFHLLNSSPSTCFLNWISDRHVKSCLRNCVWGTKCKIKC